MKTNYWFLAARNCSRRLSGFGAFLLSSPLVFRRGRLSRCVLLRWQRFVNAQVRQTPIGLHDCFVADPRALWPDAVERTCAFPPWLWRRSPTERKRLVASGRDLALYRLRDSSHRPESQPVEPQPRLGTHAGFPAKRIVTSTIGTEFASSLGKLVLEQRVLNSPA